MSRLSIYISLASFVPHLKIPRNRKIRFVQQKALMIHIISVPRRKNQASKFLVASVFRKFVEIIFVQAIPFPV